MTKTIAVAIAPTVEQTNEKEYNWKSWGHEDIGA
jgi:hypothetical protein